jgi:glycosyltransferase involved in cell wall biosynthesis
MKISLIVPCYNEEDSVPLLVTAVQAELGAYDYELILVDDGSQDKTAEKIARAVAEDTRVRAIYFRRNYGQTAAMSAGFEEASGEILVPLDADLQNDPADIPALIEKITSGYDVVSGWRKDRLDHWSHVWTSRLANALVRWITGVKLHDFGCSLKAYRRDVLDQVHLYGEMHRFIPVYAHWNGARITEMPIRHHPRKHGRSNYGFGRIPKVLLDLLVLKLLGSYATKPIHMFGFLGGLLILMGGFVYFCDGLQTVF